MKITVGNIYDLIDKFAPFDTAEEIDNVGLLVGSRTDEVTSIILSLDLTIEVIDEAKKMGANLIITHHPAIFFPIKSLTKDNAAGQVIYKAAQCSMSVISAHTNLDMAKGGISETLAKKAELVNIKQSITEPLIYIGELKQALSVNEFCDILKKNLNIDTIRISGKIPESLKSVCVLAGRGCGYLSQAKNTGCDVFLLGEIKYENSVYADIMGMCVISCGHYATEIIGLCNLKLYLQNALNELQWAYGVKIGLYDRAPITEY